MTTVAKRALAFLEALDEDALRAFVEDAVGRETLDADEDTDANAWIMGGATEYFAAAAGHDRGPEHLRIGEASAPVTIGEGLWTAELEDTPSRWSVRDNPVLGFPYCPNLPDVA